MSYFYGGLFEGKANRRKPLKSAFVAESDTNDGAAAQESPTPRKSKSTPKKQDAPPSPTALPSLSESIEENGSAAAGVEGEMFYCLSIVGEVEGHFVLDNTHKTTKYEHIIPLLVSLEENPDIDGILIILNTIGGDVEAGLAIAEMIASMRKPTVSIVLGGGHSIGVPLAVASKKSFIVPSATMTIHPVRTSGTVIGVPQSFDYLQRMQSRILRFITAHSRASEDYLREIMLKTDQLANDVGTVLEGTQAVECGLIDRVGGLRDALDALRELCKEKSGEEESAER